MGNWSNEELHKVTEAEELEISPLADDGKTYRPPTPIWSVVVDGSLYVRSYRGPGSKWYQAAVRQKAGRIAAGGVKKDASFEPVSGQTLDRVDEGYRTKYRGSPYLVAAFFEPAGRGATLKIVPRDSKA